MTALLAAVHATTLVLVLWAWARVRATRRAQERRAALIHALAERADGMDRRISTRIREIVAQARRGAGESVPVVRFADLGVSLPAVFATDNVLRLGKTVGAPIATTCDGEGTCGLCVVRVTEGVEHLTPPTRNERCLLMAHAAADPTLRLACHLRPRDDIAVRCGAA